jgi:hypothetical protein
MRLLSCKEKLTQIVSRKEAKSILNALSVDVFFFKKEQKFVMRAFDSVLRSEPEVQERAKEGRAEVVTTSEKAAEAAKKNVRTRNDHNVNVFGSPKRRAKRARE